MVETFTSDFLISKLNKSIYLQRERKILALSTKFSIFSSIFSKVKTLKILFVINIRKRNDRLCRFIQVTETTLKVLFMRFFFKRVFTRQFFSRVRFAKSCRCDKTPQQCCYLCIDKLWHVTMMIHMTFTRWLSVV